ncbi:MAG: hydroxylase, partial [Gordonia sp. (in: high G+C Gram-positive bacteria)]|nr:hydroxylase [Gordonia sp. (in: high G+C Gram-positive bacteria)]
MTRPIDNIEAIADQIRDQGPEAEELGRLPDETAKKLKASGVMKLLAPAQYGGLESHPREFAETVMKAASLDGATGWVCGIVGVHPWQMAFADPKVQEEVWGEDDNTWIASPYAPTGIARPVDGGYIFNGRWQFSSGTDHCDWIFLGAMLGTPDGDMALPPTMLHMILPRSDYTIVEDSWNVVGLKGTGSNTVVVKDVFVPRYRFLSFKAM